MKIKSSENIIASAEWQIVFFCPSAMSNAMMQHNTTPMPNDPSAINRVNGFITTVSFRFNLTSSQINEYFSREISLG